MNIDQIYELIINVCNSNFIDEPYIVGGMPRNIYVNALDDSDLGSPVDSGANNSGFKDIDLTTNDSDITRLAITMADEARATFKVFKDGHVSVFLDNIILDFSSHFVSDRVVNFLSEEKNIDDKKLFEVYSRDFTLNTLHKRLLDDKILDPTGFGKEDISNRLIRTTAPVDITIPDDYRRIYRAINFASRLNFNIDSSIIDFVKNNRDKFTGENKWVLKDAFITSIIAESITSNSDITIHYLSEMNLLPTVPLVGIFKDELIKRRLIGKYLDDAINLNEYVLNDLTL